MGGINTGDTAFVLICAALVALMTPGLAFFYGGLVRRKNFLAIMMQSFISMGVVTTIWVFFGYSLAFSGDIGGVVGLSIGGTIFGNVLRDQVPVQLAAAGVPPQVVAGFQGSAFDPNSLVGVGGNLGQSILASVPAQARPIVEPLVPQIVDAIYRAITLAIADTFWLGVIGGVLAFLAVLVIRELPLRSATRIPAKAADEEATEALVADLPLDFA